MIVAKALKRHALLRRKGETLNRALIYRPYCVEIFDLWFEGRIVVVEGFAERGVKVPRLQYSRLSPR